MSDSISAAWKPFLRATAHPGDWYGRLTREYTLSLFITLCTHESVNVSVWVQRPKCPFPCWFHSTLPDTLQVFQQMHCRGSWVSSQQLPCVAQPVVITKADHLAKQVIFQLPACEQCWGSTVLSGFNSPSDLWWCSAAAPESYLAVKKKKKKMRTNREKARVCWRKKKHSRFISLMSVFL